MPKQITPEQIREMFKEKEDILQRAGTWTNAWDFYSEMFGDAESVMTVTAGDKFKAMSIEDAIETAQGRDDMYISPSGFYDDFYRTTHLDKQYAVALDLDGVLPGALRSILASIKEGKIPAPTFITNSGSGIHAFYFLEPALDVYAAERKELKKLYQTMHEKWGQVYGGTQRHWMGQSYRIVSSSTKLGDITTAYRIAEPWTITGLSKAFGYNWSPEKSSYGKATPKMLAYASDLAKQHGIDAPGGDSFSEVAQFIKEHAPVRPERAGRRGWYESTFQKVLTRTKEGYRYSSLMALCVIAAKCEISEERLDADLEQIRIAWSSWTMWNERFNEDNIPSAKRCYDVSFKKVPSYKLEEWLGWEFKGGVKSRPAGKRMKQADHLAHIARRKKGLCLTVISEYIAEHPDASKSQIARDTGLSRPTIIKYYEIAKRMV